MAQAGRRPLVRASDGEMTGLYRQSVDACVPMLAILHSIGFSLLKVTKGEGRVVKCSSV